MKRNLHKIRNTRDKAPTFALRAAGTKKPISEGYFETLKNTFILATGMTEFIAIHPEAKQQLYEECVNYNGEAQR